MAWRYRNADYESGVMDGEDCFGFALASISLIFTLLIILFITELSYDTGLRNCADENKVFECEYIAVPKAQEGE